MKVAVTGAAGLLGTDVCGELSRRYEVVGWTRREFDITDSAAVRSAVAGACPGLVVHCAGMTDVDACETDPVAARKANADAVSFLAEACARSGAALFAVSTDYVFDGQAGRPYREEDPPNPVNEYGRSKLEGERAALRAAGRVTIIRVSGLFGRARANFVSSSIRKLRAGEPVPVVTDQVNSPSYTKDLAEGIGRLADILNRDAAASEGDGQLRGVFHLANAEGATRLEVAEMLARELGAPPSLLKRTTWDALDRPARRPPTTELNCARYERVTGARMRPWMEAVKSFLREES